MRITLTYSDLEAPEHNHFVTWNSEINNNSWWEGFFKSGSAIVHNIVVED